MSLGLWVFIYWLAAPISLVAAMLALGLTFAPSQRRKALVLGCVLAVLTGALGALFARAHHDISLRAPRPTDLVDKNDLLNTARQNGVVSLLAFVLALASAWRSRRPIDPPKPAPARDA